MNLNKRSSGNGISSRFAGNKETEENYNKDKSNFLKGQYLYIDDMTALKGDKWYMTGSFIEISAVSRADDLNKMLPITVWTPYSYEEFLDKVGKKSVIQAYQVFYSMYSYLSLITIITENIFSISSKKAMRGHFTVLDNERVEYSRYGVLFQRLEKEGKLKLPRLLKNKIAREESRYEEYLSGKEPYKESDYDLPDRYIAHGFPANRYACLEHLELVKIATKNKVDVENISLSEGKRFFYDKARTVQKLKELKAEQKRAYHLEKVLTSNWKKKALQKDVIEEKNVLADEENQKLSGKENLIEKAPFSKKTESAINRKKSAEKKETVRGKKKVAGKASKGTVNNGELENTRGLENNSRGKSKNVSRKKEVGKTVDKGRKPNVGEKVKPKINLPDRKSETVAYKKPLI